MMCKGHPHYNGLEYDFCENIIYMIILKLKGPQNWVNTKLDKIRCRQSWVAYYPKHKNKNTTNVYKNQSVYF